jgi:RNA polymerase sigma factor (sigma-70 family)
MYATSTEQSRQARVQQLATKLYGDHYAQLLRIARRNGAVDHGAAEDAVQEAFASFLRAYDPASGSPPLAWVTLTVKRNCWARSERRRAVTIVATGHNATDGVETPSPAGVAATEDAVERIERVQEFGDRMAQLKPAERRSLSLLALGYSYREIGELTGFSPTKVNRSLAEGRARLRAGA